jgi:hypothetical protein
MGRLKISLLVFLGDPATVKKDFYLDENGHESWPVVSNWSHSGDVVSSQAMALVIASAKV